MQSYRNVPLLHTHTHTQKNPFRKIHQKCWHRKVDKILEKCLQERHFSAKTQAIGWQLYQKNKTPSQVFPKDSLEVVSYLSLYMKITRKNYFQGAPRSTHF